MSTTQEGKFIEQPDTMSTVFTCGFALPTSEYRTVFTHFPGSNCTPRWSNTGDFYTNVSLYTAGKKIGEFAIKHCDQNGYQHADLDDYADLKGENLDCVLIMENHHTSSVPLDTYMFHTHRKTGVYVSYPIATFLGNKIYPPGLHGHTTQMENTLFWPGIISNEHSESCVGVLNPYNVNMSYQFTIYGRSGERLQSGVFRTKPYSYTIHRLEEIFPEITSDLDRDGRISLCIAGQYKLVCYYMVRNRASGTYSTVDHMHMYCIF